jgi:hypothetical protein
LEERAEGGGAGDAFAGRLQEHGVWGIELQDRFELFGAKVLDPGFADFGEGYDSRGSRGGGGGAGKSWREDGGEGQKRYGSPARVEELRRFGGRMEATFMAAPIN